MAIYVARPSWPVLSSDTSATVEILHVIEPVRTKKSRLFPPRLLWRFDMHEVGTNMGPRVFLLFTIKTSLQTYSDPRYTARPSNDHSYEDKKQIPQRHGMREGRRRAQTEEITRIDSKEDGAGYNHTVRDCFILPVVNPLDLCAAKVLAGVPWSAFPAFRALADIWTASSQLKCLQRQRQRQVSQPQIFPPCSAESEDTGR
ncbi:hypothetical protein F5Y19DRAFT_241708 [Xylariaceae sp. FL1651]|nr:hypothetical protein F5Y19DRAFT_241708 [Xylariaceae sp. FL1651]